jgi:hypothetical protein
MDIETKKNRHQRFWQPLEKGEGAYIGVTAPLGGDWPKPDTVEEKWLSSDFYVKQAKARAQNIHWGLDALHTEFVNLGAGVQAAFLGAPYTLNMDTVWFDLDPPIKNWDTFPTFQTNPEHTLYQAVEAHTRALCAWSGGRVPISFTDIGGQYDILFSLRGEDLLTDMLEAPETILKAQAQLDDAFIRYFNHLADTLGGAGCGYTTWIPVYGDKPWYALQSDMSVMISPKMFETFVLPSLDKVSSAIGNAIFHFIWICCFP